MITVGELLERFNLNFKCDEKALELSFQGEYNNCQIDYINDEVKYFLFQDETEEERYISISFSALGLTIYFTECGESFAYDEHGDHVVMR